LGACVGGWVPSGSVSQGTDPLAHTLELQNRVQPCYI